MFIRVRLAIGDQMLIDTENIEHVIGDYDSKTATITTKNNEQFKVRHTLDQLEDKLNGSM